MELTKMACKTCNIPKPLAAFSRRGVMAEGYRSDCRACRSARERQHRATDPRVQERDRRRYRANPERRSRALLNGRSERSKVSKIASQRVMRAVKKGILTKPDRCQRCGADGYVEGAHTDYSAPLDVLWLCRPCHRRWDAATPKTKAG